MADETPALIELISPAHVSLTFDPSGRPAVGYLRNASGTQVMLARDLTGDGDFVDAGELVQIQSFSGTIVRRSELAIDAAGGAAYVYQTGPTNTLRIAYDRSGDGDFNDTVGGTPEISTVSGGSTNTDCLGVAFNSAGRLALASRNSAGDARLGRDANGDGDVNDAGENLVIAAGQAVCDVRGSSGGGLDYVYGGAGLTQLRDLDDDGDFADAGETLAAAAVVDAGQGPRDRQRQLDRHGDEDPARPVGEASAYCPVKRVPRPKSTKIGEDQARGSFSPRH